MSYNNHPNLSFLEDAVDIAFDRGSVAEHEARGWGTNDTDLESLCADLSLPDHPSGFMGILEKQLKGGEFKAGMDLAGGTNGVVLQDLLSLRLISRGLVTNLEDKRNVLTANNPYLGHVSGDLTNAKTWQDILTWQEDNTNGGFDLVIHRPVGGLQYLDANVYKSAAKLLLDNINGNGIALFQVPWGLSRKDTTKELGDVCMSIHARSDIESVIPSYVYKRDGTKQVDCVVVIKR